jgi:hypothetical protein
MVDARLPKRSSLNARMVDAHRGNGKRIVVHADEKLTAFLELESVIHESLHSSNLRLPR